MKLLPFVMSSVAVLALSGIARGESAQQYLTAGQVAFQKGDLAVAKQNFETAYKLNPRDPVSIGFLKQIALKKAERGAGNVQEEALAKLVIPKVEFRDATFGSALDFMKKKIEEVSGGKQSVNFVVKPEIDRETKVTLNLTSIPATEAIRYLGQLTSTKFEFQKYAVMVSPAGAAAPAVAEGAGQ